MSQKNQKKKNIDGKVPETKIAPQKVFKCTKSQRELYNTKKSQYNEGIRSIIDEYSKVTSERMTLMLESFAEELGINYVTEEWNFDERTMQFSKKEVIKKKELPLRGKEDGIV